MAVSREFKVYKSQNVVGTLQLSPKRLKNNGGIMDH